MNYKKVSLKDPHTLDDLDIEWLPQATQKVVEKIFNSVDFISAETERTGGSQSHTHDFTGSSGNANSIPPYYALALLMRIA